MGKLIDFRKYRLQKMKNDVVYFVNEVFGDTIVGNTMKWLTPFQEKLLRKLEKRKPK